MRDKAAYDKKYRQEHPDKVAEINRRWRDRNPDKAREARRRWRERNREKVNAYAREYRRRTGASAAWSAVHRALGDGTLKKPSKCQDCGKRRKVEAHHHKGYAPKHHLDVQWLCKSCHSLRT